MYRKSFSLLVGTGVCAALALATMERPARAAEPQTQSITFALVFIYTGLEGDPSQLSDYIGENIIGMLFKGLQDTSGSADLDFASDSPPCHGVSVADTSWPLWSLPVTILNKGGPVPGTLLRAPGQPVPPEHTLLRAADITDVRACWLKRNGSLEAYVQESPDAHTGEAFFIITANFPVRN